MARSTRLSLRLTIATPAALIAGCGSNDVGYTKREAEVGLIAAEAELARNQE